MQGLAEPFVRIAGGHAYTGEPAGLEPLDQAVPAVFGLAIGEMQPQKLALPIGSYSDAQHDGGRPHGALPAHLDLHRVKNHKRVRLLVQRNSDGSLVQRRASDTITESYEFTILCKAHEAQSN